MFNWLLRKQKAGYVPDTMDARDAQYELLFTGEKDLPKHYSWEKRLPFFRLQMWYPFCFKGSTKVVMEDFTEKPIRDIKIGEYVRTHTGIRKQVTEVMRRKWQGKVIKMRVYGVAEPIVCTLEHPQW